jgi:hypothetical protein
MTGTLHEDLCEFILVSHWILFKMINVSETFVEKIKTRFMFNNIFSENCAVYQTMWKIMVELGRL